MSIRDVHDLTKIDPWFLHCIHNLLEIERRLAVYRGGACPKALLLEAKCAGFRTASLPVCSTSRSPLCGGSEEAWASGPT